MARVTSSSATGTANIFDSQGNPLTSVDGALNVNIASEAPGAAYGTSLTYNEVTNVPVNVETLVAQYTASSDPLVTSYLILIASTGSNISEHRIYINGGVVDKQYAYYTQFSLEFDYRTPSAFIPGIKLPLGATVQVKAINNGSMDCSLNAKIQTLEVTSA